MPNELKLTPHESVVVRESSAGMLEVEATYGPGGKPPPQHNHPSQDEHFEVLSGELRVRRGARQEFLLGEGDSIVIKAGTVHQMWNEGREPAKVVWQTAPRGRTEEWFRAIDRLIREGRVGGNGMPGPLAFAALLDEYGDVFRLAVGPEPLVRRALKLLAPAGRARGYLPS